MACSNLIIESSTCTFLHYTSLGNSYEVQNNLFDFRIREGRLYSGNSIGDIHSGVIDYPVNFTDFVNLIVSETPRQTYDIDSSKRWDYVQREYKEVHPSIPCAAAYHHMSSDMGKPVN